MADNVSIIMNLSPNESEVEKLSLSARQEVFRRLGFDLHNNKIAQDKLRKKIETKLAKQDRSAILLTEKLSKLELQKLKLEEKLYKLI